jgi:hypothetical protein
MAALLSPSPQLDTWVAGQLGSADAFNKNVRDVQRFLAYAPMTIVQRAATQSIADSVQSTITWDTETIDTDGWFTAPSTNLVCQRAGVYGIQYQVVYANALAGIRSGHITVNGNWVSSVNNSSTQGNPTAILCSSITALNVGDIVTGMTFQNSGGALTVGANYNGPRMAIRLLSTADLDITWNPTTGQGTSSNPKPPPSKPPTPHVPTNFSKTYFATWSRTYDGDNTVTWDDSPYCYQGYYSSDRGNTRSLVGFNYNQIKSDLNGASNIRVKFTFKGNHAYYNSGMTAIVGTHTYASKPGSWSTANVNENQTQRGSVAAGGTYTLDLGKDSWYSWAWKTGNIKGMAFGPGPNTSLTYYGNVYGATQGGKPYLTITYTK